MQHETLFFNCECTQITFMLHKTSKRRLLDILCDMMIILSKMLV